MKETKQTTKDILLGGIADLKSGFRMRWMFLLVIVGAILVDQVTKYLAVLYLRPIYDVPLWEGVLHLTYTTNPGAAFGMMGDTRWIFILTSCLAIPLMLGVLFIRKGKTRWMDWGLAFIIGGGVGNMIDRMGFGFDPEKPAEVVDFIYFKLINFAIFNGADTFVCVGGAMVILAVLLQVIDEWKHSKNKEEKEGEDSHA